MWKACMLVRRNSGKDNRICHAGKKDSDIDIACSRRLGKRSIRVVRNRKSHRPLPDGRCLGSGLSGRGRIMLNRCGDGFVQIMGPRSV